jgi:hypothetical protein
VRCALFYYLPVVMRRAPVKIPQNLVAENKKAQYAPARQLFDDKIYTL